MQPSRSCGAGDVRIGLGLLGFVLTGGAAIAAPFGQSASLLSEKPPEAASTMQFNAGTSTIAPSLQISYRVLSDAANAAADRFAGPHSGTTRIGCNPPPVSSGNVKLAVPQGCADVEWHITAARNGSITVKRNGDGVAIAIPVRFYGKGGFKGSLANALKMNNKNFAGTFVVTIAGALHPDKNFCPKLEQPQTRFVWGTPPDVDLIQKTCIGGPKFCVGPFKLPVGAMLTDQINRSLAAQVDAINGKIACNDVRNELKQAWKTWTVPVTLANAPPFYATITPKSLSIPGVSAGDDGVTVKARLDVSTSVSTAKPAAAPQPELPENTPLNSPAGRFALHVPLAIPYPLLASAPSVQIQDKPIKAGAAIVTPTKIEFYPSNGKLAVGITFRADGPKNLAGQMGMVWYTATPSVDNNGHLIHLDGLAMTRKNANRLWALDPALRVLPQKIETAYSYDLGPLVHDAQSRLNQSIADPRNLAGADVKVLNDNLKLGRTALLQNAFVVEGDFDADVSVALHEPRS